MYGWNAGGSVGGEARRKFSFHVIMEKTRTSARERFHGRACVTYQKDNITRALYYKFSRSILHTLSGGAASRDLTVRAFPASAAALAGAADLAGRQCCCER